MNLEAFIPLDLEENKVDLNENNVIEIFSKILEYPDKKLLIEKEIVKRLLSGIPIDGSDERSIKYNDSEKNILSDLIGKTYGRLSIDDIISEELEGKEYIWLKMTNVERGATHKSSIPKEYLLDLLNVIFLNKKSGIKDNVPMSDLQKITTQLVSDALNKKEG